MREKKIILSRVKGTKPKLSMLDFDDLAWNIADRKLYAKALDEDGNEQIVEIGGQTEPSEPGVEIIALNNIDGGFSNSAYLISQSISGGYPNSTFTDAQILASGNAINS